MDVLNSSIKFTLASSLIAINVLAGEILTYDPDNVGGGYNPSTLTTPKKISLYNSSSNIMGIAPSNSSPTDNTVNIYSTTTTTQLDYIFGGLSNLDSVNSNTLNMYNGTVTYSIFGGYGNSNTSSVTSNTVNMYDGTIKVDLNGGYSQSLATKNTVNIYGGSINRYIYGGNTASSKLGLATENIVNIYNGNIGTIYGGSASTSTDNIINISGGIIKGNVYGGSAGNEAKSNIVNIYGGVMYSHIYGGSANTANNNIVNISNGIISGNVYGGNGRFRADSNTINISNGIISGNVYGSYSVHYANDNIVNISGGTIEGDVYGGSAGYTSAVGNTVNILGSPTFGANTILYGGFIGGTSSFQNDIAENTLNLKTKDIVVKDIKNFQYINFYLPSNVVANDTILTLTDTGQTNISYSIYHIGVGVMSGDSPVLNAGDEITLIDKPNGELLLPTLDNYIDNIDNQRALHKGTIYQGISNAYSFSLDSKTNSENKVNKLVVSITSAPPPPTPMPSYANPKQKAILESSIAIIGMLNYDIIDNILLDEKSDGIPEIFAVSKGYDTRLNSGSHVDVRGANLITGISTKVNDSFIYSAFFEAGYGKYDSFNSFDSGDIKGSGDNSYFGFGLMSKTNLVNNFYIDNSIKFGQVKSDFKSDDFGDSSNKISASFDSKRAYYGLSLGVGNIIELDNRSNLDIYTKLYYTRVGSDSVDMSTNDKFRLDTFNSFIAKLGARYNYEIKESTTLYTGAAYEYEFDAKQKGYNLSYNYEIDPTDMQGSSGSIEAGIKLKPLTNSDRLTLDLGIKGLSGKKEGVSGNVGIEWRL
ncbi:autotransporter domain protein [Campylobacter iguaniorum]|uniref:Autotransporter domain protein n=1 Tax=Campylobacter iguaniorum TaxID=1244531 RepID=A0A076FBU4_9BACT|nr:autotransporter outer membrane beta-barrel domain-containing protein [Campylobacter iguaniorum]AII15411.1 autotransporter domain protein [Campylobacter iguaniorum]